MKQKIRRFLSILLTALMLAGILPAASFATDSTTTYDFSDLSGLKTLIGNHDGSRVAFVYNGAGELVISEDIQLPQNVDLDLAGQGLRVASGAAFTMDENTNLVCGSLTVEGRMISSGYINAGSALTVTDTMTCSEPSFISLSYPSQLQGLENIQFENEWQRIHVNTTADADTLSGLLTRLNTSYIDDSRVQYQVNVWGEEDPSAAMTLQTDVVVPKHVVIEFNDLGSFTVAEGYSMSVEGELLISSPMIIDGVLNNNGNVFINHNTYSNGILTIGSNGTYAGNGGLQINSNSSCTLNDCLSGLKLDDFEVETWTDPEGNITWNLTNAAGLIKLGTPTDLSWGTRYNEIIDFDETEGMNVITGYDTISQPGIMSWKTALPDQAQAQIKLYDENNICVREGWAGFDPELQPEWRSMDDFLLSDLDSGTYYFTVQSMGDHETYCNSDIAKSGTYTYVKPSAQLSPCTDPAWVNKNDEFVSWAQYTLPSDIENKVGFEVQFYYSPTENGEYEGFGGVSSTGPEGTVESTIPLYDHFLQDKGVGYYKFRVRLISLEVETICNSEWSDFSPALDVTTIPQNVESTLDMIINNAGNASAADIRSAVQTLDPTDLKTALVTDQDNTTVTAKLAAIESMAGGPAQITVTSGANAFQKSDVSIVGANLNTNTSANDPITLIIDKPASDHVIPELYDSAVAVKFSMTLANVPDPEHLEVPVKITLPVPESINPDFLVVFHYHSDGSHELLYPYVHENNGKFFADFVLTSFSDFIMTQEHVHVYDQEIAEEEYLETPADCKHPAVYHKSCTCKEMGEETFEYGSATDHTFANGVCSVCGFKQSSIIEDSDPTKPADPTQPANPAGSNTGKTDSPATGDTNLLWLWSLLAACSFLVAYAVLLSKKKCSK